MKVEARNLKVREQRLTINGTGVSLDPDTKRYNVSVDAYGEDGRKLRLWLTQEEMGLLWATGEKQKRYNAGDFTDPTMVVGPARLAGLKT